MFVFTVYANKQKTKQKGTQSKTVTVTEMAKFAHTEQQQQEDVRSKYQHLPR